MYIIISCFILFALMFPFSLKDSIIFDYSIFNIQRDLKFSDKTLQHQYFGGINMDMNKEETIFGDDWQYSKAKTALLRSAAVVMREQGPRAATLKNIAGKAGVTEPAIFRHFDGVDGVFLSHYSVSELFYTYFIGCFKNDDLSGLDRLEAGLDKILGTLKNYADFAYIIAKPDPVYRQYPKLKEKVAALDASFRKAVVDCLKEAKSTGQLVSTAEIESLATVVIGTLFGLMYSWMENVNGIDPRKDGKKVFSMLYSLCRIPGAESKALAAKTKAKPKSTKK